MRILKACIKHLVWIALRLRYGSSSAPLKVLAGPAKGATLQLDVRGQGSYWTGSYDQYAFDRLPFDRYLKAGDSAWDCGAFVGYYAAVFRHLVGDTGKVVAFEASSSNHQLLANLPRLNNWNNVETRHAAVGPDHTHIEFAANLGGASGPLQLSKTYAEDQKLLVERVRCFGVDELVDEEGVIAPRFIKFDLESAEEFALHNGPLLYANVRPVLLLELHGETARDAAGRFLETYRYRATQVERLASLHDHSTAEWLHSLREHAVDSAAALQALPYIPHMLLLIPSEHPDWTA